jgi:uncharacterized protein
MNCPACGQGMRVEKVSGIAVDVCAEGCGGLWFDRLELRRLDELHEGDAANLLNFGMGKSGHREGGRLACPCCTQKYPLIKRLFHPTIRVEVEECPGCAGHFLDPGELGEIRKSNRPEAEREEAARQIYRDMVGAQLKSLSTGKAPEQEESKLLGGLFRALLPRTWLS